MPIRAVQGIAIRAELHHVRHARQIIAGDTHALPEVLPIDARSAAPRGRRMFACGDCGGHHHVPAFLADQVLFGQRDLDP